MTLGFGFKDWVGAPPDAYWSTELEMLLAVTSDIRTAEEQIVREHGVSYTISDRRGCTSWGADSGEVIQVLLFVARSAADATIAAAVFALWQRLASRSRPVVHTRAELAEAIERAKWTVVARYAGTVGPSVPELPSRSEELTHVGDAHDIGAGTWTITLSDNDGYHYRVVLAEADGLLTCDKVERWKP